MLGKNVGKLGHKKISFGKIEKINPIFEFGSSKTTLFIVHGRKIQLYALTVFFFIITTGK